MGILSKATRYGVVMLSITIAVVSKWEGKSNSTYLDIVQVPTICYGTTKNVKLGDIKTDEECTRLLVDEINRLDTILAKATDTPMTPEQRAAFLSWMYNVGEGNFARSTLLKKLQSGDVRSACNELPRWVYAGGHKIQGLINRRKYEMKLCMRGLDAH